MESNLNQEEIDSNLKYISKHVKKMFSKHESLALTGVRRILDERTFSINSSFLSTYFGFLFSFDNARARRYLLRAAMVYFPKIIDSEVTGYLVSFFRLMMNDDDEFNLIYAFKCLCNLGSVKLVRELESDIYRVMDKSGCLIVKYALHLFYNAYMQEPTIYERDKLGKLCLKYIFEPEILLSAISILVELEYNVGNDYFNMLFPELLTSNYILFSKFIMFLKVCSSQQIRHDFIANLIYHFQDYKFCLACVPIAKDFGENDLFTNDLWGALFNFLNKDETGSYAQCLILEAMISIKPSSKFRLDTVKMLLNSTNEDIRNIGCTLQNDVELGFIILESLTNKLFTDYNTSSLKTCMYYILPRNESFLKLLFNIYGIKTKYAIEFTTDIAKTFKNENEKKLLVDYGKKYFQKIENDSFYMCFIDILADISKDTSDKKYLLNQKLLTYEDKIKLHFLSNVFLFWNKTNFMKLETSEKNILYYLLNSSNREVRQTSSELLYILDK